MHASRARVRGSVLVVVCVLPTIVAGADEKPKGKPVRTAASGTRGAERDAAAVSAFKDYSDFFACESVILASLGGYDSHPGAGSRRFEDHLAFARSRSRQEVIEDLARKLDEQLDHQARRGKAAADRFYGEVSARLADYGVDLQDDRSNQKDARSHEQWAAGQVVYRLKQDLRRKVRIIMSSATRHPSGFRSVDAGREN